MIKLEEKFSNYYKKLEEAALNERDYYSYRDEIEADIEYGNAGDIAMNRLRRDIYHDKDLNDQEKRSLARLSFEATEIGEKQKARYARQDAADDQQAADAKKSKEQAIKLVDKIKNKFKDGISLKELKDLPEMDKLHNIDTGLYRDIVDTYKEKIVDNINNRISSNWKDPKYVDSFLDSSEYKELNDIDILKARKWKYKYNKYQHNKNWKILEKEVKEKLKDKEYFDNFAGSADYNKLYWDYPNESKELINDYKKQKIKIVIKQLKAYGINATKDDDGGIQFTIERNYDAKSITKDSSPGQKHVIVRDSNGNIIYIPVSKNYLQKDLNLLETIGCKISMSMNRPSDNYIRLVHSDFGEEVLAINLTDSDISSRIMYIQELNINERKDLETKIKGKINDKKSSNYEIVKKELKSKEAEYDKHPAQYKLNSYGVYNKDTNEYKQKKVTNSIGNKRIESANNGWKKTDIVRKPHQSWAVTDGNIVFANAATAMIYNNWDPKKGNFMYDVCSGHEPGTDPWTTPNGRYATAKEIENAEAINGDRD